MKPWQAKWYRFRRLNPNKELIIMLFVLAACTFVFVFLPSARNLRIERREKALASFVDRKKGREATQAEISAVLSTHLYLIKGVIKGPSIYIFMPALNNNIAVLGRLSTVRPGLDGYAVYLVPLPQRESPTSEKAVGMCLVYNSLWQIHDLLVAAPDILSNAYKVDDAWSNVSGADKTKIKNMVGENSEVQRKFGNLTALVVDGNRGYLMENWFDVGDLKDLLSQLHKAQGSFGR